MGRPMITLLSLVLLSAPSCTYQLQVRCGLVHQASPKQLQLQMLGHEIAKIHDQGATSGVDVSERSMPIVPVRHFTCCFGAVWPLHTSAMAGQRVCQVPCKTDK